ncbi:LysR family transcriptional regulator [Achromobacter xylosoxidans]
MSKLNYRQTEMLWAVVMAGSISGAARLLNISQLTVSRMLAHTEKAMGVTLFERVRGGCSRPCRCRACSRRSRRRSA